MAHHTGMGLDLRGRYFALDQGDSFDIAWGHIAERFVLRTLSE